jgi:hypothetical protein
VTVPEDVDLRVAAALLHDGATVLGTGQGIFASHLQTVGLESAA